jgi:hypothetical protein
MSYNIQVNYRKKMLYCKSDTSIYQVHIPRTGGRYTRDIFLKNSYEIYHWNYNIHVQGIESPHLHYPLYNLLEGVENSKQFTVVRDPFEKFKSAIQLVINGRQYPSEVYSYLSNKDWLFSFLDYERNVGFYLTNLFRPQYEFISNETLIYKFEDGLKENFIQWSNENMNTGLTNANFSYEKHANEFLIHCQDIDDSIELLIQEYYAKDYEIFNY